MLAHQGLPPTPENVWQAWTFEVPVLVLLATAAALYGLGFRDARRAGASGVAGRGRHLAYFGGLGVVAVALVSPLDAMSGLLFSAHMVQHLLLTLVAAPLLVLARPGRLLARGLPRRTRRKQGRIHFLLYVAGRRRTPWLVVAWLLVTAGFWMWHAPVLYEAALDEPLVHVLEHVTMFSTALLFWWTVAGVGRRSAPLQAMVAIFLASLTAGALGALLTLSPRSWYRPRGDIAAWGLTPLEDQQLAGVIMWMPGGLVYLVAGVALFAVWISGAERSRASGPGRRSPASSEPPAQLDDSSSAAPTSSSTAAPSSSSSTTSIPSGGRSRT